jgi:hypothetical protein
MKKIKLQVTDRNWNTPQYLSSVFNFKSNRREILLSAINEFYCTDKEIINKISESFECLHFSAATVDDILDNETFRNEQPCYYVREGFDKSVVGSFSSFVRFLEIASNFKALDESIISSIRDMIISEEADAGLRVREKNLSPYEWYYKICSTKSSNEILAIISFINNVKPISNFSHIKQLFFEIGRLAQMFNDKRDIINSNPLKRFSKTDNVKLTYSVPLAIFFEEIDNSLEPSIGKLIKQSEFLTIHRNLNTDFLRKRVAVKIDEQQEIISQIFKHNSELKQPITEQLISSIIKNKFYKLSHYEVFP